MANADCYETTSQQNYRIREKQKADLLVSLDFFFFLANTF